MKKITALILIFIIALCPLYLFSTNASDDYIVEDGVLLSYTGNDSVAVVPLDVYYIADEAFKNNTSLKTLKLHDNVSIIGNEAFYGCTSLLTVEGGEGVTSVGAYAFYDTQYLNKYSYKVVTLGSVAIGGTPAPEFKLAKGITSVAPYAFSKNLTVTSFVASDSLLEIGEGAFLGCSQLSSVSVSNSLSYVGPLAFQGTPFVDKGDSFVVLGDGILVKYNGSDASVTTPESVKQIAGGAFYGNISLESITVSEGVSYIGMRTFMNCSALNSVSLPDTLLLIEQEAFAKCTSLKNVVVPDSVVLLGDSVFYGCTSIDVATVKTNANIPAGMFYGCSALRCVLLNHSITSVGDKAFQGCSLLSDIALSDSVAFIGADAFKGADNVTVSCQKSSYAYSVLSDAGVNVIQSGDANTDGKVNIRDATYIQKFVANLVEFTSLENLRAEANFDGKVNIRDATYIQKLLAGLE